MNNLISGKEALIALANGGEVDACATLRAIESEWHWFNARNLSVFEIEGEETLGMPDGSEVDKIVFRVKPKTIMLGNIEVPAPFEPKEGETCYFICDEEIKGYKKVESLQNDNWDFNFGAWRTEDEIKQVVEALRSVFK